MKVEKSVISFFEIKRDFLKIIDLCSLSFVSIATISCHMIKMAYFLSILIESLFLSMSFGFFFFFFSSFDNILHDNQLFYWA